MDAPRAEAVPAAMDALVRRGVSVVLGRQGSAISAAAAEAAAGEGMLLWETGAVGEVADGAVGGSSFIRLAPVGANLDRAAVSFVRDELTPKLGAPGPLRYAVAYEDDPYARAVGDGAVAEAQSSGQVLAGTVAYRSGSVDYAALSGRMAAVRPDALFASAHLDDGVALRRAVLEAKTLFANIGSRSSYCMPASGAQLGADAVGLFGPTSPTPPTCARTPWRRRLGPSWPGQPATTAAATTRP